MRGNVRYSTVRLLIHNPGASPCEPFCSIMKRISKHIAGIISLAAVALTAACSATDPVAEAQTTNILSYLQSLPRDKGDNPLMLGEEFYMVTGDGIYKYFGTKSQNPLAPLVQTGDKISFWFDIRVFNTGPSKDPLYTNIPDLIKDTDWPDQEMTITVGDGHILKSIDNALPLCQVGSEAVFIIPSDKLFGDEAAGTLEADTALMYKIIITKINQE